MIDDKELSACKWKWCQRTLYSHKSKGSIIKINPIELYNKIDEIDRCEICNTLLAWIPNGTCANNSPTLDRIFNDAIIEKDNTQIICHRCNRMKQDMNIPELVEWAGHIVCKYYPTGKLISDCKALLEKNGYRVTK